MKYPPPAGRAFLRIAHRGASASAPENTLAAFQIAIRQGVDAIEMDVRLTADGVPVILHDPTLDRTTSGEGLLAATSLAAVRRVDAGSWFAQRFKGERVPTLAEAIETAHGRCGLNIELKIDPPRGGSRRQRLAELHAEAGRLARAVARDLRRARRGDLLALSSFSVPALEAARAALPEAPLGLLVSRSTRGVAALHRRLRLHALHPHTRLASRRRIGAAHRIGLRVYVWPVNESALLSRLVSWGVDGLMSDDPLLFRRFRPSMRGA